VESNTVLVRISDVSNSAIFDVSDAVFTISSTILTLVSPNGGESWAAGSSQQITWTSAGSLTFVKLEYSINDGTDWTTIINSTENDSVYEWSPPAISTNAARVRISDASDAIPADVSDSVFEIVVPKTLTLLSPNGGESWDGGSSQTITWTSTGTISAVQLEYSLDNGNSWTIIISNTANDGSEIWIVPEILTSLALVRVSDAGDAAIFDTSDGVFTIVAHGITVTSPNGGEIWYTGRRQTFIWNFGGDIPEARIEYSLDNGRNWIVVRNDTHNDGRFHWIPQGNIKSDSALARISDANNLSVFDVSDGVFSIDTKTITLTSPNGGETWLAGSTQTIAWTNYGPIDSVEIEFSLNTGTDWEKIAEIRNRGTYEWALPAATSNHALVRINGLRDSTATDTSDAVFYITDAILSLTSPNGGEVWDADSTHVISWTTTGEINSVTIEYSLDNGKNWNPIVIATSNHSSYEWTVPQVKSDSALVRISDASEGIPFDVSEQVFSIKSTITSVDVDGNSIPERFELSQNYPNPFNPETKIDFAVPNSAEVHLAIYNLKGELIRTLLAGQVSPGHYTVLWDGHNQTGEVASSGVYIYKIRIGEWQATKKLTLLK
jgi:hypothetical protein